MSEWAPLAVDQCQGVMSLCHWEGVIHCLEDKREGEREREREREIGVNMKERILRDREQERERKERDEGKE